MRKIQLGIYAAAHFLVDLGCALLILGRVCPAGDPAASILFYNLLAFAVQMPIGLMADRWGKHHLFAAAGCLLVIVGWVLTPGLAAAVAAGLGNAAFHVGGGLHTLNGSGERAGSLGLFVSPGAFGIYLGSRFASADFNVWACLLLAAAAIAILLWGKGCENAPLELPKTGISFWFAAFCLLFVVVLRSALGMAADLPWKTGAGLGAAAVCAVAGGKAAGGYLADRFGMLPTALTSLGLAAICFLGSRYSVMGLAALFLFNMTMSLSLWAMARLFPGMKGFSFGLLTFGLFLGFLPVFFGIRGFGPAVLTLGTLLSLPLLTFGLRRAERREDGAD